MLLVQQVCTQVTTYFCELSDQSDNVPNLPIMVLMTDNGDGTYTADYAVTGGSGTVSISVELIYVTSGNSLIARYFPNYSWVDPFTLTTTDANIDFNWGGGNVGPLSVSDSASVIWTGYILSPTTGNVKFTTTGDDGSIIEVAGVRN